MKNRLAIFFFYDQDGVVDDYVTYYLEHLKPFCSELCVVVNGKLEEKGNVALDQIADKLLIRENIGFDSCAYRHALRSYGYAKIAEYDELILCNFTCYGPVFPFAELFDKMDAKKCDFWGMTCYPRVENIYLCKQWKYDYIPQHVMSYFMGIRTSILRDECFKEYWENLKTATSYAEAIAYNELIFTEYFEKRGYTWDVFMSRESIKNFAENSATFHPMSQLHERNPLVKRRAFASEYENYMKLGNTAIPRQLLEYIDKETEYDVNLIWDNLFRTMHGSEMKRNLHLNFFLDEKHTNADVEKLKESQKVAMLLYSYYDDMTEYALNYARNLPEWVDIHVYVVSESTKEKFETAFSILPNRVVVNIKENRGQLASAVMIDGKKLFSQYDLVCVTQTKKSTNLRDRQASEAFCDHCWNNVLKSRHYVLNILQAFAENPRLGYLCAIPPHWGNFSLLVGNETYSNASNMIKILEKYNIPASAMDYEPVASYGECYWVRSRAYDILLSHEWKHEDFPEADRVPKDGCVLNALERLNPIFSHLAGYYAAWVAPLRELSVYFDNIYFCYRNNQEVVEYFEPKEPTFFQYLKYNFFRLICMCSFGKARIYFKRKKRINKPRKDNC